MHKVVIVDDEPLILEGITQLVDWEAEGTVLVGQARNGAEAFDIIVREQPDIVITDIRMPRMDGLQLAAKVADTFPRIAMIMLSGFSDFDYAQTAMRHGVKHYLLKPCNEIKITEALREAAAELKRADLKEQFVRSVREELAKVLPHVKEQVLKEFLTNKTYGNQDWEYYRRLFDLRLDNKRVRLVLFQLEPSEVEFEHVFAVQNIAKELLPKPVLSTTVGEHALIVVEESGDLPSLEERIFQVRRTFRDYYKIDLTIALSDPGEMAEARQLYKQTRECLKHRFYLAEGSLITGRDIADAHGSGGKEFVFDSEDLLLQIKTGRWSDAASAIDRYFEQLGELRLDIQQAKSYVIELYMAMIRLEDSSGHKPYMEKLLELIDLDTLQAIRALFKPLAEKIANRQYERRRKTYSAVVSKAIRIVEEQLGNSELSLNWVAQRMLYLNPDYLGKLFKRETGEKFSNYVLRRRITQAIDWLRDNEDMKIVQLAERLGYGDYPQYFSQVFKKYTGCTPTDYIKVMPINAGKPQ
ncbi:response regulator [Cohnella sp. CFH 77786]|uniref:response regulator transcription factor n=1 Tax=Cohnella sp. CFH 77786 TaxID=2662265 RepID=UPI001C60CF07|nr:response regulator [Cohnella sp. CFH 77786]MBW5447645.1 response regulator [Cohnella sp. CFH 77786]